MATTDVIRTIVKLFKMKGPRNETHSISEFLALLRNAAFKIWLACGGSILQGSLKNQFATLFSRCQSPYWTLQQLWQGRQKLCNIYWYRTSFEVFRRRWEKKLKLKANNILFLLVYQTMANSVLFSPSKTFKEYTCDCLGAFQDSYDSLTASHSHPPQTFQMRFF